MPLVSKMVRTLWGTMLYSWMQLASPLVVAIGLVHMLIDITDVYQWGSFVLFVTILNPVAYWYSQQVALAHWTRDIIENRNPYLYDVVSEQAERAGLPVPQIIESRLFTAAFATGRTPRHAVLGVSPILTCVLGRRELGAVIAHEIAHVRNHDSLLGTFVMLLVGGVLAASMLFGLSKLIAAIVLVPVAVSWIRESRADTVAVCLSDDPLALASALKKLPQSSFMSFLLTLPLHTHLPTKLRVWRLKRLAGHKV